MIEIKLKVDKKIVQETLQRIGIANFDTCILYPSAYLVCIDGKDYICHFKELFKYLNEDAFDNMSESDLERRNSICFCIQKWGLIECLESIEPHKIQIDTIRFEEKRNWIIKHKIKIKNLEAIMG